METHCTWIRYSKHGKGKVKRSLPQGYKAELVLKRACFRAELEREQKVVAETPDRASRRARMDGIPSEVKRRATGKVSAPPNPASLLLRPARAGE